MDPNGITSFQGGLSVPRPLQKVVLKRLGVKKKNILCKVAEIYFHTSFCYTKRKCLPKLEKIRKCLCQCLHYVLAYCI